MNKMSLTNLIPGKHVVVTDFDGGEGILVDLNTKKYYQLNETAMVVWKGLEQGKTMREIAADITSNYEVALDRATVSVERIVDNFQNYKLVSAE
jgi:coenzyme PQQ synthesis protein D (PqqD)